MNRLIGARPCTLAMTATGLLWAVASAVQPDHGLHPRERYAHVAAHPAREGLAGLLFIVVAALFVVSAFAILGARPTGRGARAVRAGGVLIGLGSTWMAVCYAAFDMAFLQLVQQHVPAAYVERIIDGGASPWQDWFDVALLCVLAGPAVLAVGLRRSRRTSWLPLALWLAGVLTYAAVDFVSVPGRVAALIVCTAALGLLGRALDSVPDVTRAPEAGSAAGRRLGAAARV